MDKLTAFFNPFQEIWFSYIVGNSLHVIILFAIFFPIAYFSRNKTVPVFLYLIWILCLLRFIIPPTISLPLTTYPGLMQNPISYSLKGVDAVFVSGSQAINFSLVFFLLWLTVIFYLFTKTILNHKAFHQELKTAKKIDLFHIIKKISQKFQINSTIHVYYTEKTPIAFTTGLFRPSIYLPVEYQNWDEKELESILAHEMAHIKRKDILLIYLQNFLSIVFFFHPLIYFINQQINFHRERICDDLALSVIGETPVQYGKYLLKNIEQCAYHIERPLLANGFLFAKKTIFKRFEYLLNKKELTMQKMSKLQIFSVIILCGFVFFLSCNNLTSNESENTDNLMGSESKNSAEIENDFGIPEFTAYDVPPKPITKIAPEYPEKAKEQNIEGKAFVKFAIDEQGEVIEETIHILKNTTNNAEIAQAAIDATKQWKFSPALSQGKPVKVWISMPFKFYLK